MADSFLTVGLKLLTPRDIFKDKIIRGMLAEINKRLSSMAFQNTLRIESKKILKAALENTAVYQSMIAQDGQLRAELGVVKSESAMNSLVRAWVKSTHVRLGRARRIGDRIVGDIVKIQAVQADYQDVLSQAYASYTTEKGTVIPWLDWLLTRGEEILVTGYRVWNPPVPTAASRTGTNTIMKKTRGAGWGVPIEFSGTPDHNFCTEAIDVALKEIGDLIYRETTRRI